MDVLNNKLVKVPTRSAAAPPTKLIHPRLSIHAAVWKTPSHFRYP